jgi:hypothetical protein
MRKRAWLPVLLVASLALVPAGCGGDDDDEDAGQAPTAPEERVSLADQWAGRVKGTKAYISLFTLNDGQAGSYLADGAKVATLVLGRVEGDKLSLRPADGTTVTGTVAGDEVTGTVKLDGREYAYTAERATGEAGWYRGRKTTGGETIAAGFIVLDDGSFRGAVRRGDEVIANPDFDPSDLVLEVEGAGRLEVLPVAEFVKREQKLN